jgi:uncharacterized protein YjiS (DUF1127 family)
MLSGAPPRAYDGRMILRMQCENFLRMHGARGMAIEVVDGCVWITEAGRAGDSFLEPGRSYRVDSDGLVLIGTQSCAANESGVDITVRRSLWFRIWSRLVGARAAMRAASRTRRELRELPDRMLRDIGLRRDQIDRFRAF